MAKKKKKIRPDKKKLKKQAENREAEDFDRIVSFTDNKFVSSFDVETRRFHYSKDFYVAMYHYISEGYTYVEAYNKLGFDTDILGTDRANSAGKRAVEKYRNGELDSVSPGSYNGAAPTEEMLDILEDDKEKIAFLIAQNLYLKRINEAQKKIFSMMDETGHFPSKNQK